MQQEVNVAVTSSAGCDSVATLNLVVNPQVAGATNTTICDDQLPYAWNGLTFNAAGNQSLNITSSAGCDSVATLNLVVNTEVTVQQIQQSVMINFRMYGTV